MAEYGDTENNIGFVTFNQPYYAYSAIRQTVPPTGTWPVSIGGHVYDVDTSFEAYRRESFHHKSFPAQRESINLSNIAGEGTVNTEGLWRREMTDWSMGAGQTYLDRKQESVENRFYKSKGVDPWTPWQLSLLPDTVKRNSTATKAIAVGTDIYYMNSSSIVLASTNVTVTGITSGAVIYDICTDGKFVYAATDKGIWQISGTAATLYVNIGGSVNNTKVIAANTTTNSHSITAGSNANFTAISRGMPVAGSNLPAGSVVTGVNANSTGITINNPVNTPGGADTLTFTVRQSITVTYYYGIRYCNNTLIAFAATSAGKNVLFAWPAAPTKIGAVPDGNDLLMLHPDSNWIWTDATGGQSQLYFSGYSATSGFSTIYRSSIQGPATAGVQQPYTLNYPISALPIARGEQATAVHAYLNYIFVGTNKGIRMCQTMSQYDPASGNGGDLKAGPIVPPISDPVNSAVTGIVGNDRFVYFVWNNFDGESNGLGRLDLTKFVNNIAFNPAYASDRMVYIGDTITWLDWNPSGGPLISTANGVYVDKAGSVSSGWLKSGNISYGIPDNKVAVFGSIDAVVTNGSVDFSASTDGGSFVYYGSNNASSPGPTNFGLNQSRGELFNVQLTLNASSTGVTPTVSRFTIQSYPAVATETNIMCVLKLYRQSLVNGSEYAIDPYAEYYFLDSLRRSQTLVEYIEGPLNAHVIIDNVYWMPQQRQDIYTGGFQGDLVVSMKTVGGFDLTPLPTTV